MHTNTSTLPKPNISSMVVTILHPFSLTAAVSVSKQMYIWQLFTSCVFYTCVYKEFEFSLFILIRHRLWNPNITRGSNGTKHNLCVSAVACQELLNPSSKRSLRSWRRWKWQRDQSEHLETNGVCRFIFWIWSTLNVLAVPVRGCEREEEVAVFVGGISFLASAASENALLTQRLRSLPHCLFLVITSTTIQCTGQGEARTLVRGVGRLRNNKQMFFDDNCREGKRSAESRLVKRSLVETVPPLTLWGCGV